MKKREQSEWVWVYVPCNHQRIQLKARVSAVRVIVQACCTTLTCMGMICGCATMPISTRIFCAGQQYQRSLARIAFYLSIYLFIYRFLFLFSFSKGIYAGNEGSNSVGSARTEPNRRKPTPLFPVTGENSWSAEFT